MVKTSLYKLPSSPSPIECQTSQQWVTGSHYKSPNGNALALLGILPLEAVINQIALNLFISIAWNCDTIEYINYHDTACNEKRM